MTRSRGAKLTDEESHELMLEVGSEWREDFRTQVRPVAATEHAQPLPDASPVVEPLPARDFGRRTRSSRWVPMLAAAAVVAVVLGVGWLMNRSDGTETASNNSSLYPWACGQTLSRLQGISVRIPGEHELGGSTPDGQVAIAATGAAVQLIFVRLVGITPGGTVGSSLPDESQQMGPEVKFSAVVDLSDGHAQVFSPRLSDAPCTGASAYPDNEHLVITAIVDDKLLAMDAGPLNALGY